MAETLGSVVTGGAGFIGSHVTDELLQRGHRVLVIDDLSLGRMENLAHASRNSRFKFIESDLSQSPKSIFSECRSFFSDCSRIDVWHMAANSDIARGSADATVDLKGTFLTTFHALELAKALQVFGFFFASTSAVYGDRPELLEEHLGPLYPISNYGAMKLGSEGIIGAAREAFLKRAVVFRFPNVIGSRGTHGALFDFITRLKANPNELNVLGNGTQAKPYLHVSELVKAMFRLFDSETGRIDCFNIGVSEGVSTVRFIAEEVVRQVAPNARINFGSEPRGWLGDVPKFKLSTKKIEKFGWASELSSDGAVKQAIAELKSEVFGREE